MSSSQLPAGPHQAAPLLTIPAQILPVQPPWLGALGCSPTGAAQPSPAPGGCWDPKLTTKALQENSPTAHPLPAWLPRVLLLLPQPTAEGLAQGK